MRDSDATAVFTLVAKVTGGSLRTIEFAEMHGRPVLHISRDLEGHQADRLVREFVESNQVGILNVAGSRESKEPGIHGWVMRVLEDAFFRAEGRHGH